MTAVPTDFTLQPFDLSPGRRDFRVDLVKSMAVFRKLTLVFFDFRPSRSLLFTDAFDFGTAVSEIVFQAFELLSRVIRVEDLQVGH